MFKAFADENRLRILHLLRKGELCVCDLMAVLKIRQSRASRHLAYLRATGLVTARRQGLWVYYSLSKPTGQVHRKLVACLGSCLEEVPVLKQDRRSLANLQRKRC